MYISTSRVESYDVYGRKNSITKNKRSSTDSRRTPVQNKYSPPRYCCVLRTAKSRCVVVERCSEDRNFEDMYLHGKLLLQNYRDMLAYVLFAVNTKQKTASQSDYLVRSYDKKNPYMTVLRDSNCPKQ